MVIHKDMFDKTVEDEKPTVMVSGGFDPVKKEILYALIMRGLTIMKVS